MKVCLHPNKTYGPTAKVCNDCGQSWPIRGLKLNKAAMARALGRLLDSSTEQKKLKKARGIERRRDPIEIERLRERAEEKARGINPPSKRTRPKLDKSSTFQSSLRWHDTLTESVN